jgi:stage II sporulation protein AB (anti-sigma F factor)
MPLDLELELPAVAATIPRARRGITEVFERLGADEEVIERAQIAVTEAASNCVLHGYGEDATGKTYMVEASVLDDAIVIVVHDCGVGITSQSESAVPVPGRGLGLGLIHALADLADVSSQPGKGTRVVMHFEVRTS